MVEGVTDDIGEASVEVKRRIADLSALLDLAQSEAEDAVLDAAAKLRMLRKGAGLLARVGGLGGGGGGDGGEEERGDEGDGADGAQGAAADEESSTGDSAEGQSAGA